MEIARLRVMVANSEESRMKSDNLIQLITNVVNIKEHWLIVYT